MSEAGTTQDVAGAAGANASAGAGGVGETPPPELVVLYADYSEPPDDDPKASTQIRAAFVIENLSDVDVPLANLTLRYYYTLEAASAQVFECDFFNGDKDCAGVQVTFVAVKDADYYAELSFEPPAGDLVMTALGGKSGLIRVRFRKENFSEQNQTNDYSFRESDGIDPVDEQDHVTLYLDGKLVYGLEPP